MIVEELGACDTFLRARQSASKVSKRKHKHRLEKDNRESWDIGRPGLSQGPGPEHT